MPNAQRYEEFAEHVRLATSRILSYIQAMLLNWSDTEDLFQETCLTLWEKYDEFQPGTSFLAWALRIAQNKVLNFQKKQARRTAFTARLRDTLLAEVAHRGVEAASANLSALNGCMERLSDNDKQMLNRCYVDDTPIRQIADTLARSPKSVQNSLHRIRCWLLECIKRELRRQEAPSPVPHDLPGEEDAP